MHIYTVSCGVCRIDTTPATGYLGTMSRGVQAHDPDSAMRKMAHILRKLGLRPVGRAEIRDDIKAA